MDYFSKMLYGGDLLQGLLCEYFIPEGVVVHNVEDAIEYEIETLCVTIGKDNLQIHFIFVYAICTICKNHRAQPKHFERGDQFDCYILGLEHRIHVVIT